MTKIEKVLYVAHAFSTGGREGSAQSNDGALTANLTTPKELGGSGAFGTNPEQLFAAGYSACFIGALKFVASQDKVTLPAATKISARVGIGPIPTGFGIEVEMDISIPGMDKQLAQSLVDRADVVCPFSHATKNNINVTLNLI